MSGVIKDCKQCINYNQMVKKCRDVNLWWYILMIPFGNTGISHEFFVCVSTRWNSPVWKKKL